MSGLGLDRLTEWRAGLRVQRLPKQPRSAAPRHIAPPERVALAAEGQAREEMSAPDFRQRRRVQVLDPDGARARPSRCEGKPIAVGGPDGD